jgi:WD40 repeat protein
MASLFISYSRKNIESARKLTEAFKGQDLDFWIDWEGIPPTVDWWKEIESGIEKADIFIFLISPDSCKSKVCKQEIEHALKNGKRLIPLVVCDVKGEEVPAELSHLNWIFVRETDDFDLAFTKLITAIKTDYAWAQAHRELQVKALEWERSGHENSFLLFGKELQDGEHQLATNTSKEPHPTDLQREYVHKSRQAVDRRRVRNAGITTAGLIALAALAIFGFVQAANATAQANIAETQRVNAITEANGRATAQANAEANQALAEERAIIARSRELVARSLAFQENQFQLSLLLGIEAFRTADTSETRSLLLSNTLANSRLAGYIDIQDTVWGGARIALSPDGKILATEGPNHTIILWDLNRREPIGQPLEGHARSVTSLAFSPDGTMLVSGGADPPIILWDVAGHQTTAIPLLIDTCYGVDRVVFSPDEDTFACVTYGDNTVVVWDVMTYQLKASFPASTYFWNPGSTIAFSPDGKILASGGCARIDPISALCTEGEITLTDTATFERLATIHGHSNSIIGVAFNPDGTALASSSDNTIIFWDLDTYLPQTEPLRMTNGTILDIAFSPDGKKLASGDTDHTVILWDLDFDPPVARILKGHSGFVRSIVFSNDGKQLVSAGCEVGSNFLDCNQSEIIVWDVDERDPITERFPYDETSFDVAFSPSGETLAAGYFDRGVILWDIAKHQPIGKPFQHSETYVSNISLSSDGKILAAAGGNNSNAIILWDAATQKTLGKLLMGSNGRITALEFSPDGMILASANTNTVQFWDVKGRKPIGAPIGELGAYSMSFSPDGKMLAFGSCKALNTVGLCDSAEVILWDIALRRPIGQPLVGGQYGLVRSLAFSPDSKVLAEAIGGNGAIGGESAINLWDTATGKRIGKPIKPVAGAWTEATSIAFSPDGNTLAGGMSFGGVVLWDVTTRLPIAKSLTSEFAEIFNVAFSPDGTALAIATSGGVRTLNLNHLFWIEKTCQRASRNLTRSEWSQFFAGEEYRVTCPQWPAGE